MTKILFSLVLVLCVSTQLFAEERTVHLDLEEAAYAVRYEFELYQGPPTLSGERIPIKSIKSQTTAIAFATPVGIYSVRARSFDRRGISGPWTVLEPLEVPPAKPKLTKAVPTEVIADAASLKSKIDFNWGSAEGADRYVIEIFDISGKLISSQETTETSLSLEQAPGTYVVKIKSAGKDNVMSEPVLIGKFVIKGAKLSPVEFSESETQTQSIHWKSKNSQAIFNLKFERSDTDTNEWESVGEAQKIPESEIKIPESLEPGKYRVTVQSEGVGWTNSDPVTHEFLVKPTLREISSIPNSAD